MATQTSTNREPRVPLSRERVLLAAMTIADQDGIESLTMRNLASALDVEAMSLYYHVANKEAVLDGVVDVVVDEINEAVAALDPTAGDDWKKAMRMRILAARDVLLSHPWAPDVIEKRTTMSLGIIQYFDGVVGIFREGGFSYDLAHHAMHALGSRAMGFTQELFEPDDTSSVGDATNEMFEQLADQVPYLIEMLAEISHGDPESTLGWCDDQVEFEFGLDLVLDGLDHIRETRSVAHNVEDT